MPFTWRDANRHTFATWVAAVALTAIVTVVLGIIDGSSFEGLFNMVFIVTVIVGAFALVGCYASLPVAWLVGRALRRVRHRAVHVTTFALLGMAAAFTVWWVLVGDAGAPEPVIVLVWVGSGLCCGAGRWWASRNARTPGGGGRPSGSA